MTTFILSHKEHEYYAQPSSFTELGQYKHLIKDLPKDIPDLCETLQGLIVHYVASGTDFPPTRKAEIDTRYSKDILKTICTLDPSPLTKIRQAEERFVGCCRDFATLFVAILRERGIPARTRIGFAPYLNPSFNHDHVVAEYWNCKRWVMVDPQITSAMANFNPHDMPADAFITASQAWHKLRQGKLESNLFGVAPHLPYKGDWFIRNYVILELAALNKHEMLLWDWWGAMSDSLEGDLGLIDKAAELMLQGDGKWQDWLKLFEAQAFFVPDEVMCYSPTGSIRPDKLENRVAV